MEQLKKELYLISKLIFFLERGDSVRHAQQSLFSPTDKISKNLSTLIDKGIGGEPILGVLQELQLEYYSQLEFEIDREAAILPLKALVPLLVFQFPALMMLILGPFLSQIYKIV